MNTIFSSYENISNYFWPIPNSAVLDFDEEAPTIQKLDSIQVRVLKTQLQQMSNDKTELSLEQLHKRVSILNTITQDALLPERTWYFHIITLGVSYLFLKLYDQWQANKILQEIEQLLAKYLHPKLLWQLIGNASHVTQSKIDQLIKEDISIKSRIIQKSERPGDDNPNLMMLAILQCSRDMKLSAIKLLIAAGVDVNAPSGGQTPLMAAIYHELQTKIVQTLLDAAADPNINHSPTEHNCALITAIYHNDEEIVKALIKAGANKSAMCKRWRSGLSIANELIGYEQEGTPERHKYEQIIKMLSG